MEACMDMAAREVMARVVTPSRSRKFIMASKDDVKLRTIADLVDAGEWMFNRQRSGNLDAKAADAMNTTLKGQYQLVVGLRLKLLDIFVKSQIKKFSIPTNMLP